MSATNEKRCEHGMPVGTDEACPYCQEPSSLAAMPGSVMTWIKWTRLNDPAYGTDALINHRDGTPEFGLIQIAQRTKHGWRVVGGNIPLDDVSHFAVITSPNNYSPPSKPV